MKRKVLSLILLCLAVLLLASCAKEDKGTDPKATAAAATASATVNVTQKPTLSPSPIPTASPVPATIDPAATAPIELDPNSIKLVSQDCDVTVSSSTENTNWSAAFITDGDIGDMTYGWTSQVGIYKGDFDEADVYEWACVDLGLSMNITRVIVYPRQDNSIESGLYFPVDYTIEVSSDDENWTVVASVTGDTCAEDMDTDERVFTFKAVSARYVRIVGTALTSENAKNQGDGLLMQLSELEVYALK